MKKTWIAVGLSLASLTGHFECAHAQQRRDDSFLVTNVRVFDGERVLENTQVAVVEGKIHAVGNDLRPSPRLRIVDGKGGTLLPGFIDAHVHVKNADELRQALRFGVTTVLDMGATIEPEALFALRATSHKAADMADMRVAGYFARADGTPRDGRSGIKSPSISTVEEARQFAAARHAEGADHLKLMIGGARAAEANFVNLDEPRVRALVETAHSKGMLALAHIETIENVDVALSAGIDGLAHAWRRGGANAELARRVAEQGVFVVPTLVVPDGFALTGRASLLADPRFKNVITDSIREVLTRPSPLANLAGTSTSMTATKSLYEAKAILLVGTDSSTGNPVSFGISIHREFELLREAGLSPMEILAAATARSANAFRLTDRGRIAPKLRADLVLVRRDPTADILETRDIVRVWKAGIELDRSIPR